MKRERADLLLLQRGLVASRQQARAAILAGEVTADGVAVTKAGQQLPRDVPLEVASRPQFVSRGGIKLAHALDTFEIDPHGMRAVDVGASTGGFTDCLLQRGTAHVTAIDVGYGQLAWGLRNEPRVTALERTNVRHLDPSSLGDAADLVAVDVSFISVGKILGVLVELLAPGGILLILIKPQFEGERGQVGKGGVVRDAATHTAIVRSVVRSAVEAGLAVRGLDYSPITGADGNIEFWLYAAREEPIEDGDRDLEGLVEAIVTAAHAALSRGQE